MALHPPLLYSGYVLDVGALAYAIASLILGEGGDRWLVATRRFALISWGLLGVGIVAGAWWSYAVLGWGGYWAWDPVENAAIMPWLTSTAYLHSVMVEEKRSLLRTWNLALVVATFVETSSPSHRTLREQRARLSLSRSGPSFGYLVASRAVGRPTPLRSRLAIRPFGAPLSARRFLFRTSLQAAT